MSKFSLTMSDVYKRLKTLNLDETFVRQVALPSWWNKELDNKPIAVLEATGHIAQRLNLDQEEQESNRFAAKLLVGNLDGAINARKFYNAKQLAKKVKDTIQKNNDLTVEPCTLAFNYGGYNLDYFAMAQKAAQHLDPDSLDGIQTINRFLEQYIQWDQLGDDDQILEAKGG